MTQGAEGQSGARGRWQRSAAASLLGATLLVGGLSGTASADDSAALTVLSDSRAPGTTIAQIDTKSVAFDIPAQPLTSALALFGQQSGLQITVDGALARSLPAPALSGTMTAAAALQRLLAGTGLTYSAAGGTVTIHRIGQKAGDAIELNPITVEGATESAYGPVDGYVAKRSATGTKTDTPLIETPQSISVVGAEQIEDLQAQTIGDALRYTPGILKGQGFNRTDDGFYMRGFQINTESLYVNGLRNQFNIYSSAMEPYAMERIEVLRGPASVLYGQASPGGVVNAVTKKPTLNPLHEIEASFGSFDRKQLATDHGGGIDEAGRFSYRFTALGRKSDTMVDYIPDDKVYVAPAVTWRPTDDTTLTVLGHFSKTKTMYYYGFPSAGTVDYNPNGQVATDRFIGEPDFNKWNRTVYSGGYEFEHKFTKAIKVNQNLRYSSFDNDYNDIAFLALQANQRDITRFPYARDDGSTMLSVDTNVQGKLDLDIIENTLLGGVDYTRGTFSRVQHVGTVATLDLYDPVYGSPVTLNPTPSLDADQTMDQVGLYAQDQIAVGKHLRLLFGGRHDWATGSTDNKTAGTVTDTSDKAFTGRAGIVYLTDIGLAPYASYAESFQPQAGTDAGGSPFKPTTAQQYELGLKYEPTFMNASVTMSLYQLTRQNLTTTDPDNPGFQVQTGEVRSRGFELEAKANPLPGLNVIAGYTFTNAEVTKSNSGTVGNRPENTPAHMASLWGEYQMQQTMLRGLKLGGGVRYVGDTVNLTDTVKVPSYTVFDAMIGYEYEGWEAALNVVNLFDRQYVAACTYGCFYGDVRTIIGTLSYHW